MLIVLITGAVSGCSVVKSAVGGTSGGSDPGTVRGTDSGTPAEPGKITVSKTPGKITFTGDSCVNYTSEPFVFDSRGLYRVTSSYKGADGSHFAVYVGRAGPIDYKSGGHMSLKLLGPALDTNPVAKNTTEPQNYTLTVEKAEGPWSVEIAWPSTMESTTQKHFSGISNISVTPYFWLEKGQVNFKITQSPTLYTTTTDAYLFNADRGEMVEMWAVHDENQTIERTVSVPSSGNYSLMLNFNRNWDLSYSQ